MTVNGCVGHVQRHFPEADETKWKLFFHNLEGRSSLVRTTDGFMPFVVPENVSESLIYFRLAYYAYGVIDFWGGV